MVSHCFQQSILWINRRLTWNGGVERSVVSYFARDMWARWLERLSEKASAAMKETVIEVFSDNAAMAKKARAAKINHKAAMLGRKLLKRVRIITFQSLSGSVVCASSPLDNVRNRFDYSIVSYFVWLNF